MFPKDIGEKIAVLTPEEFIEAMEYVWADVCERTEDGGVWLGHKDPEAYERYHDANVLARTLGLVEVGPAVLDGERATVFAFPAGGQVIIAFHGGALLKRSN